MGTSREELNVRVIRYHASAIKAVDLGDVSTGAARENWYLVAERWRELAGLTERMIQDDR